MPTNLPPEYFEAEDRYREATTTEEKVARLEELIGTIPKHKGTDKIRAGFRKRLSKLKASAQAQKKTGKQVSAFYIGREGAGQVVLVGATNAGKSSLVAALSNAEPTISAAPFTTWEPTPGMMEIDGAQIQLLDTPSLDREFVEPELFQLIARADFILLIVDLQADPLQQLEDSIATLENHKIIPLHLKDQHPEGRYFMPLLVLVNKNDDERSDENYEIFSQLLEGDWSLLPISTKTGRNLDQLKQILFDELEIMRVFSKTPGKEPDFSAPFVMKKGSTVEEFARKVHKDFYDKLKTARVWGEGADFDGQMVSRDHVLKDGDVVELRI